MLLYVFLVSGSICLFGELILDNSKLTAGHITSIFAAFGSLLGFLGIYEKLIKLSGYGAIGLITNFGYSLYKGGIEGYLQSGFLGMFKNFLSNSSLVIVSTVFFSFLVAIFFKPKN